MPYFSRNAKQNTAAWCGFAFLLQALLIYLLADRAPIVGRSAGFVGAYIGEAMLRGTPFFWSENLANSLLRINGGILFYPLTFLPYPILGCLVGYRWPLAGVSFARLLLATFVRFAAVWLVLEAVGLWKLYNR